MAFPAKDGSMHHSAGRASLHDNMSAGAEKKQNVAPMKKPGGEKKTSGHPAPSPHSIEEHVSEHGPAHKMEHHHDEHGSGKHHVTTHHGEGEGAMHHSEHDSAEAAHDHMGVAMGATSPDEEEGESPDMEAGEDEGAEMAHKGGGIPGLS